MKDFERVNGKNVSPELYENFERTCKRVYEDDLAKSNYSVMDLFKTPRLRRTTIILISIWMAISLVFDGHVRNVSSLGLDVFVTFTVASASELPANLFLTFTLDRWGRRWYACLSMILSGLFSLLATAVPVGIHSTCFAIIGRFFVNFAYSIGLQYAAELLPTVVRAQGVAFVHIMGYVASIISPYIVYLGNSSPNVPLILLGLIGILGGTLALFLPETMDQALPQTLLDGEEFGRHQKFLSIPCIRK